VQAVVLAAGSGARLSPLTSVTPKALLPIANRPLIDYVIDSIQEAGIKEIVVATGYMGSRIDKYLKTSKEHGTIEIECVKANRYREGPLYSFLATEEYIHDDFLLVPADLVLGHKVISELVKSRVEKNVVRVATSREDLRSKRTPVLCYEGQRRSRSMMLRFSVSEIGNEKGKGDKKTSASTSIGVTVCPRKIFEYAHTVARKGSKRVVDALNEYVTETGLGRCIRISGQQYWFDVDTIDELLEANSFILRKKLVSDKNAGHFYPHQTTSQVGGGRSDSDETLSPKIIGPVLIGERCIIGEGSIIGPCVSIQNKCIIGRFAELRNAIILRDSKIPDSAVIEGAVVCGQITVRAGKLDRDVENE
jgi:NDP-sugar pyrophosphorylase family protein